MARKKIKAYKGFEKDWTCRGFQYEIGKTYTQTGDIKVCNNGFHACEEPLRVFEYYTPCDDYGNLRKFAEVEQSGEISNDNDKTASSKIKIKTELSLMDLAKLQVEYIKENVKRSDDNTGYCSASTNTGNCSASTNTGYSSASTNTGNCSASTNTGYCSASTNTGDRSASTNTGDRSASTNTGNCSASTNTGDYSRAEVEKSNSVAFAFGYQSRARAKDGWIIIVDWREDEGFDKYIENIYTAKVGGKIKNKKIQSNVWYWFEDGKLKSEE